jgi:putative ABC transport system ATP-binding protein
MLAGLEKPTHGAVYIKGKNISEMSERKLAAFRRKNLGFVFQSYNLLNTLTAVENVALPLCFRGIGKRRRNAAAKKMLTLVGLGTHLNHKPNQMSGGQQQRVGIARAFVTNPAVVFADEPTGNLDSKTTIEVMELMTSLAREHNETLVVVTHDREIAEFADRILYLFDGNIRGEVYIPEDRTHATEIINEMFEKARLSSLADEMSKTKENDKTAISAGSEAQI